MSRNATGCERSSWRCSVIASAGGRSGLDPDQLALGLEDLEQSVAAAEAQEERVAASGQSRPARQRKVNRGALPEHLPRVDVMIDVEDRRCPCCAGALHPIGVDVAERLVVILLQFRVLVVHRPKYACRTCPGTVVQAPAPPRLIEGGLPTEGPACSCDRGQVRRSSSALPPSPDLCSPGHRPRPLDPRRLDRPSRLAAAPAGCQESR